MSYEQAGLFVVDGDAESIGRSNDPPRRGFNRDNVNARRLSRCARLFQRVCNFHQSQREMQTEKLVTAPREFP